MRPRHFVIVGGGTCAGSAASTLRAEGFDGAVTIVSNEPMPSYERPPLSKDYLTGKTAAEDLAINPALNRGKDFIAGRKLLAVGIPVTAEQLRDEDVNLARLIPRSTSRTARPGA